MRYLKIFQILFLLTLNANSIAYIVIDDRDTVVRFDVPPTRIVSLLPSLTESLCAIGRCEFLVGVDEYSNFPLALKSVQHIGNALEPSIERIVSLKPDLVLMSQNSRSSKRLEQLGLKVFVLETRNHSDVQRVFSKLDLIFKSNDAHRFWESMNDELTIISKSLPRTSNNIRIYFEVASGPYAAGQDSFIGETLSRMGTSNIVPQNLGDFPKLNPEFIVKADPDLIIIGDNNLTELLSRPGWAKMRAIRDGRVCALTKDQSDVVVRPGPRMVEAAKILAQCIVDKGLHP